MSSTPASNTSTPALYLSNWQDMVGIWKASKLSQLDTTVAGPRLAELHYLGGSLARRGANQIVDYSGFFRDESGGSSYTHVENFDSEAWFESGADNAGTLTTNYLTYEGAAQQPRLTLSRSFAGPPNARFFVVRYSLTNPTAAGITFNILDQVHLNNLDQTQQVHAWYDPTQNAFIADMTASGQLFVVFGSLQAADGFQTADNSVTATSNPLVAGWYSFDADGTLKNNTDVRAGDVALAFNNRITVAAGASSSIYFYLGVCETQADATTAIAAARASSGEAWFAATAAAYTGWLANGSSGRRVHFDDDALNTMFDRTLILVKNIQNPVVGTFAATTNPIAYGYKNWVRDASVTAIGLDASGHFDEAEKYWRWMAASQGSDGTWKTTYNNWDGSYVPFVEPEYDSIGAFMFGVYHHYSLKPDPQFLGDLWKNVKLSADWILSNLQSNGFGQADYSIWEEGNALQFNSYTQAWYVNGLYATQALAELLGDTALSEWYAGGVASILTAMQRPSNWSPPGQWNPAAYYNRAVNADGSLDTRFDSSSDVLMALSIIDHESARATNHIAAILRNDTKGTYGVARYPGDVFYYTGAFSPGGNEALAPEPSWPQMSLWIAVYDILRGRLDLALPRMQWCASIYGKGYMPPGEAVSNVTMQPVLSSMSEPLTASAFVLTALLYEGQAKLSVIPPVYNAGTAKTINVSLGTAGDWPQWNNVPYFVGPQSAPTVSPLFTIKRVYISNDYTNLYLRVDNAAGSFPLFEQQPLFGLHVYSQDFANSGAAGINFGIYGQHASRPMNFMAERRSDSDTFQHWSAGNGTWTGDRTIDWVMPPQWDTASGRLEAVIPISALASGDVWFGGAWADILVVLAYYDSTNNWWTDGDRMLVHYRLSTPDQAWLYGNIEQ